MNKFEALKRIGVYESVVRAVSVVLKGATYDDDVTGRLEGLIKQYGRTSLRGSLVYELLTGYEEEFEEAKR